MKEEILKGKKYRILADPVKKIWHRISFWTSASDVEFEDGTRLQGKTFGHCILTRETKYSVGAICYCNSAPSWVRLRCSSAGTTASTEPAQYKGISQSGITIVDGSAQFVVEDVRNATSVSTSTSKSITVGAANDKNTLADTAQSSATSAINKSNTVSLYVGSDKKLHFKNASGSDSVLNIKIHNATYTFPANDVGGTKNLGDLHKYRYVNAQNVYNKGYQDGINKQSGSFAKIEYTYHHHTINGNSADNNNQSQCPYADNYQSKTKAGCFQKATYTSHSHTSSCPCRIGIAEQHGQSWGDGSYDNRLICNLCGTMIARGGCNSDGEETNWGDWSMKGKEHCRQYTCGNLPLNAGLVYTCSCGKTNGKLMVQKNYFK